MEPKIVDLDRIILVGLPFYGDPSTGGFGQAWHRFFPLAERIPHRVNPAVMYGVEMYGPESMQEHKWTYFPSTAVSQLDVSEIPDHLFAAVLPAARYAVFTAKGGLTALPATFRYAYDTWLPASEYEGTGMLDFELYDERFRESEPDSELDVYIPIRLRQAASAG
jgi:AraC family transcriptional regulator